ncbi:NlpC/P60 family protein [Streptomyces sp. UG1]|uniref:C40 family peptidase n=1 Tax=Streptomyces sp. UG1 TaxID=3417652 RepID=UPI003CEDA66C
MAPEGTARPGALSLPGMRNSALASAALTSVALLGQTAGATPSLADESPSREEVNRRVAALYNRAETDSGTFNATRASSTGPPGRAARPADAGRAPAAPPRGEDGRRGDRSLDRVTRQWFDGARANLGPIVPAAPPRPARALDGADPARESSGRAPLELTAGPATGTAPSAELPAGPLAALPAAPEADPQAATQVMPAIPARPPSSAPATEPAAADPQQRSGLRTTKEQNQRKLDRARELLSMYAMRQNDPLTTAGALPAATDTWGALPAQVQPSAEEQWQALQAQSAADLTTVPPGATAWPTPSLASAPAPALVTDPLTAPVTDLLTAPALSQTPPLAPLTDPLTAPALSQTSTPGTASAPFTAPLTAPFPSQPPPSGTAPAPSTALTSTASQDTRAIRALEFARAQVGKPCVWGTTGPEAFDGPGLTQAAWKSAGITLPRTAQEQATAGRGVALTYLEPGDLVLFHVGHVGIYSGSDMMIHAPGPGAVIREESIHYAGESAIHSAIRPA